MNKTKPPTPIHRAKSGKIRNYDNTANNQQSIQRKTSKVKLDDVHEFRQSRHDSNHVQFSTDSNLTIVKENDKPLKPAINKNRKQQNQQQQQSDSLIKNVDSSQSLDSSDTRMGMKIDSNNLKDKWKRAYRTVKQKLKSKPKYEEVDENETNENENNVSVVESSDDLSSDDSSKLNSTSNLKSSFGRRSTSNHDGLTALRRHTKDSLDENKSAEKKFNNNHSYIRSAIPCLPLSLGIICFILNAVLPGTGTILSGLLIVFFGETRLPTKSSGQRLQTLAVNVLVGLCQFVTIILLLVGWFWSLAWGVYIVIIALEKRRQIEKQKLRKKNRELKVTALKALGLKAL